MYVTLEPCCHFGKTPPCTQAIIEAGIEKVIVAATDPNPLVAGKGIQELRSHLIEVETGLLAEESEDLNRKFNYFMTHQRPYQGRRHSGLVSEWIRVLPTHHLLSSSVAEHGGVLDLQTFSQASSPHCSM